MPRSGSSRELHTIVAPMALIAGLTRRMRRPSDNLALICAPPHRTVRADFPHTAPQCITAWICRHTIYELFLALAMGSGQDSN